MLRGIPALAFGLLCFVYPGVTLSDMKITFGAYTLAFRLRGWVARQAE